MVLGKEALWEGQCAEHRPPSPQVNVGEGSHPERVKVYGPGVEKTGLKANEPTYFTVDCSEAGQGAPGCGWGQGCVRPGVGSRAGSVWVCVGGVPALARSCFWAEFKWD